MGQGLKELGCPFKSCEDTGKDGLQILLRHECSSALIWLKAWLIASRTAWHLDKTPSVVFL